MMDDKERIKELCRDIVVYKRQIRELELRLDEARRNGCVPYPVYPTYPTYPTYPWEPHITWCDGGYGTVATMGANNGR